MLTFLNTFQITYFISTYFLIMGLSITNSYKSFSGDTIHESYVEDSTTYSKFVVSLQNSRYDNITLSLLLRIKRLHEVAYCFERLVNKYLKMKNSTTDYISDRVALQNAQDICNN